MVQPSVSCFQYPASPLTVSAACPPEASASYQGLSSQALGEDRWAFSWTVVQVLARRSFLDGDPWRTGCPRRWLSLQRASSFGVAACYCRLCVVIACALGRLMVGSAACRGTARCLPVPQSKNRPSMAHVQSAVANWCNTEPTHSSDEQADEPGTITDMLSTVRRSVCGTADVGARVWGGRVVLGRSSTHPRFGLNGKGGDRGASTECWVWDQIHDLQKQGKERDLGGQSGVSGT